MLGVVEQSRPSWMMASQSSTVVTVIMGQTAWEIFKKGVGWKRPGRLLASFIVRSMQRSLCLSVCVFFLGEGVGDGKWAGQQGWQAHGRGGHGGETRRVKVPRWAGGVGRGGEWACAAKFLVPVARQHPLQKENIRAEGQRMEEVQRETYSTAGGGNGWPGARCSDAARRDATLLPEAWCDLLSARRSLSLPLRNPSVRLGLPC